MAVRLRALFWVFTLLPAWAAAQDQRAVLELVVNDVPAGEAMVILRDADVWVGVTALSGAGLRKFEGRREVVSGQELVSLASLAPAVTFAIDEIDLRLTLKASPDLLGEVVRRLSSGTPTDLVYGRNTSGYVNYSLNWGQGNSLDVFTEAAASVGGASAYTTLSALGGSATRGISNITIDQRRTMRRWTFGDSFGYSGPLGGDAWIAGVSVAREFAIDPYYVRYPTLSLSTPISLPSVMEVHVNGQVVSQTQVAPGRIDVRNLPLTLGRNDARIIVRDAFGATRELSTNYYLTTTALARGVHEYRYSVGMRREALGTASWEYGDAVALARHRVGLTDSLTVGARVEAEPGLLSAGPSMNVRLPVGELETATSVSRVSGVWGAASLAAFNYVGRPIGAGGSMMVASRTYGTLSQIAPDREVATQANVFANASVGRVGITVQQSLTRLRAGNARTQLGVLSNVGVARHVQLTASVTQSREDRRSRDAYVGVTMLLGQPSVSVSYASDSRGERMALDAQRSLPVGVGYGYQLHAEGGQHENISAVGRYQGRHGRYEVRHEIDGGREHTSVSVMGALLGIGGGMFATRPVQDSFALIRVPGVEGVRAFASHQEIGRTGRGGNVLVPDLQAYYGNILNIADSDVPLQYAVRHAGMTLAPPYRGGAIATFDVEPVRRIVGKVRIVEGGQERIPAYGELTISRSTGDVVSPVGSAGDFYFENLDSGVQAVVVTDRRGTCEFTFDVPGSDDVVVDLGTVYCRVRDPR